MNTAKLGMTKVAILVISLSQEVYMLDNLHCQGSLNSSLALLEQVGGYKWTRYLEQLERTDIKWCDDCG